MGRNLKKATIAGLTVLMSATLTLGVAGPASSQLGRAAKTGTPSAAFTLSSFNVLGSSHTPPGGRYADGPTRMKWAVQLLNSHSVDVAGLQEMQYDQLTTFLQVTNGAWGVYPGFQLRKRDTENSIAWRTNQWTLVSATTVTIPYFDGNPRPMPVVLLRNRATGVASYFANFHNPGDTAQHRNQGAYRQQATTIEIALANDKVKSGIPLFVTGDMNDRAPYFCRMTGEAPRMKAARGGTNINGVCDAQRPRAVDWIFGRRATAFTNYVEDRGPLVAKTSDHPMIVSDVRVDSTKFPRAVLAPTP
jgi:hypothetical protein